MTGRPGATPTVTIAPQDERSTEELVGLCGEARQAAASEDVVGAALALGAAWSRELPRPGGGRTADLWSVLATLGAVDLTVARVIEPHLDALAILAEAEAGSGDGLDPPARATWGVYAAEGPGQRLTARGTEDGWVLDGHKPWCSLADRVSHALMTAWVDDTTRGLFAVDLRGSGVRPVRAPGAWVSHGLPAVTSCGVVVASVRLTSRVIS